MTSDLRDGDVIHYPYRWRRERDLGQAPEGRKERPCCVVIRTKNAAGATVLFLAAISSKSPLSDQFALQVPETERRRADLGRYPDAWIYVDEINSDILNESWLLRPQTPIGSFSPRYLDQILSELRKRLNARAVVNRARS